PAKPSSLRIASVTLSGALSVTLSWAPARSTATKASTAAIGKMSESVVEPRPRRPQVDAGAFFARKSIAVRLIVFALLLASGVATLVGSLSYARARRALEREARARLAMLAREVVEDLHRELEDRVADITNWSHLEVMRAMRYRDVDKELAQFFRQLLIDRGIYRG